MQNVETLNKSGNTTNTLVQHQVFKDETTLEKVHRHLSDINDQITDQDILNIKTEMTISSESEFVTSYTKEGFSKEEISHKY